MSMREDAQLLAELEGATGHVTPQSVVDAARDADHPWHSRFVWDNAVAGDLYRLVQARVLIRSVRYERVTQDRILQCVSYVRDPNLEGDEAGYISVASLATDEDRARSVVVAEFKRVASALRRAREVAGVLGMSVIIDELAEQVTAMTAALRHEQPSAAQ